jgi:hypothetical protein
MDCFASLAMTNSQDSAFPLRGLRPGEHHIAKNGRYCYNVLEMLGDFDFSRNEICDILSFGYRWAD